MSAIRRFKFSLRDFIRFNPICRALISRMVELRDSFRPRANGTDCARSIGELAKAARICPSLRVLHRLERKLKSRTAELDPSTLDWDEVFPYSEPREIRKGIILKKPVSQEERGVLYLSFEDHWLRLLRYADLEKLHRRYHLILAPTWSPPHDLPFLVARRMWPGPLFHILSAFDDIKAYPRFADNLVSIPLISSNWVNPDLFKVDEQIEKEFDIVMLANFATYKRHWLLFKVLRKMSPDIKVLLLGRGWEGRSAETILGEARAFGVEDRITLREGLSDEEMVRSLRSAKVGVIFSGNEGACVAVVETMFWDIPMGLFADAIVGSRAFVNETTGMLFNHRDVHKQLAQFIDNYHRYHPRKWVMENAVSAVYSNRILNEHVRESCLGRGEPWTKDLLPLHWRPNPVYLHEEDNGVMRDGYEDFKREYGIPLITPGVTSV